MEGRHVWALYLVKSRRGSGGSAPNLRWGASVGGAVRQTPTTILSPTFRVNMTMLWYPH